MMELSDTILKEDHQRTIPAPSLDYIGWVLSEENILKLLLSKIAYFTQNLQNAFTVQQHL
jgi:hypothetical protein